jgi:hypothetical protein
MDFFSARAASFFRHPEVNHDKPRQRLLDWVTGVILASFAGPFDQGGD